MNKNDHDWLVQQESERLRLMSKNLGLRGFISEELYEANEAMIDLTFSMQTPPSLVEALTSCEP